MHILFLPSWYPNDPDDLAGSFFREQALALKQIGVKVGVVAPTLLTMKRPISAVRNSGKISIENDEGIPTYRSGKPHLTPWHWQLTSEWFGKAALRLFDQYMKTEGRPDVLHVHAALPAGGAAMAIKARNNIPFVLSEHSTALARGRINSTGLRQMRNVISNASASYAVSSPFARLLERKLAMGEHKFGVMHNSVSDAFMAREFNHQRRDNFQFCHISLLDEKKNIAMLIQAFASAFRDDESISLVIGGDGPLMPDLKSLAFECGVLNQINFLGKLSRSQVRDVLSLSDAFVLPSHFETFGVVLIEAAAMGVPIIATRCGGPEDIVTEKNGILVPVQSTLALAAAMKRMFATRVCWDRQNIRDDCRERFGANALAMKWQKIYSACAKQEEILP